MSVYPMAPKHHGGKKGGRRRTKAQMDKDAKALDMYCQGKTYPEIAEALGWKARASAFEGVRRALLDRQKTALEAVDNFAVAVAFHQQKIADCQKIIDNPPIALTASGKIVVDPRTGDPVLDITQVRGAIAEQRHHQAELSKLQGNYAPTKQRVEVVTDDVVQREIDQLTKELAQVAKDNPVPSE